MNKIKSDTCHYCGIEYHPMGVFTHKAKPYRLWVCDDRIKAILELELTGCRAKAEAAGWQFRPELTPKR